MLTAVIGVIVLLGGLIFFHELGHFLVAKYFGVRVEVFSLGFGKKLVRKKWGETEYCLSLFPLGGYVKLMGDDPYKEVPAADAHRAFSTQKLYKRFLIVAAGPLANLLLAFVLFTVVFWFGQPMASSRIGNVAVESPAWTAGFRPLDRVIEVDKQPVESWRDVEKIVRAQPGESVEVLVKRGTTDLRITAPLTYVTAKNAYGEDEQVKWIKGLSVLPLAPKIGVSDPRSPAYLAGLRTGDLVTKVGPTDVRLYENFEEALSAQWRPGQPVTITVQRPPPGAAPGSEGEGTTQSFTVSLPETRVADDRLSPFGLPAVLGIYPSDLFIGQISPDSPAEKGGLKAGDRIVKLDGQDVYNFESISERVQAKGKEGQPVQLELERDGERLTLTLTPVATSQEDPFTRQQVQKYLIGFSHLAAFTEPEAVSLRIRHPLKLVAHAAHETYDLAERMVVSIGLLVMGKISVKNLGGPVLIASVAGKSLDAGIIPFLQMMALISINLFLLNLFPIPILDGGHLLFFTIEAIQRRPVSVRTMEIANQMGMVFILVLVGLTLFNDITRMVLH